MSNKRLAEFNIQNAKYATKNTNGEYETPKSFTYAQSFARQANVNVQDLYGDGRIQASFISDLGLTGSLGLMAIDGDYERAMGRRIDTANGVAEINQTAMIEHAIYIETNVADAGQPPVIAKAWYYGVTSSKADETINQNTENVNINAIEYPLTIKGTKLMNNECSSEYVDAKTGQNVYVYRLISLPGDSNYATFGNTVPVPKAKATSEVG